MEGQDEPPELRGIIPQAFNYVFDTIAAQSGCPEEGAGRGLQPAGEQVGCGGGGTPMGVGGGRQGGWRLGMVAAAAAPGPRHHHMVGGRGHQPVAGRPCLLLCTPHQPLPACAAQEVRCRTCTLASPHFAPLKMLMHVPPHQRLPFP